MFIFQYLHEYTKSLELYLKIHKRERKKKDNIMTIVGLQRLEKRRN